MRFQRPTLSVTNTVLCALILILILGTVHANATSCLWRVISDHNTVYLLGSVHVLKQDNYPLHNRIYQAYRAASHLVFEINLDELSSPSTQMSSLRKGMYSDGQTLKNTLSPKYYALVKTKLKKRGYAIERFQLMKPWMLASNITILELQKLGFGTEHGVDQHIFQKAKAEGKSIGGLETIEYQLNLFDSLSPHTQTQFLLQTLDEIDILEQQTQQLVESWTHGQIEGLEVMLESMQEFPEVYEALITRRNNEWMPHIESYLEETSPYMIVVGTLHLLGEEGLLAMLKAKGYVIQQL